MQQAKEGSRALSVDMERSMTGYRGGKDKLQNNTYMILAFHRNLWNTALPDTVLGTGNTAVNKTNSLC